MTYPNGYQTINLLYLEDHVEPLKILVILRENIINIGRQVIIASIYSTGIKVWDLAGSSLPEEDIPKKYARYSY